jgi:hypothetical protein
MITGGEPMLYPSALMAFIGRWRALESSQRYWKANVWSAPVMVNNRAELIVYTANLEDTAAAKQILKAVDGMTVTLHSQSDLTPFSSFNYTIQRDFIHNKSLRLNVFKGIEIPEYPLPLWDIKRGIVWQEDCPIPEDKLFVLR